MVSCALGKLIYFVGMAWVEGRVVMVVMVIGVGEYCVDGGRKCV